ncbi:MAG: helix-turn-helix transcriptional regulator [Parvibaculum sp.]|nr:helix-turn-helix transcriptional regulator [Parvibaculum sp.]
MPSFEYEIGEKSRVGSRFVTHVRNEIQRALATERESAKITQQAIADKIGVNRSVVNRQLTGLENMTLKRVAELLWAIGWVPSFSASKQENLPQENEFVPCAEYIQPKIKNLGNPTATTKSADFILGNV